MSHPHETLRALRDPTRSLRDAMPETWSALTSLHDAAMSEGEVSIAIKEVVALAISVVKRCDGCIAHHAKAAARSGATPGEVTELLGIALMMDGGPASVYAPRAWDAFCQFHADTATARAVS